MFGRLRHLELLHCERALCSAQAMAALAELCCRCPTLERVELWVFESGDGGEDSEEEEGERGGEAAAFGWEYAVEHVRETLRFRGGLLRAGCW